MSSYRAFFFFLFALAAPVTRASTFLVTQNADSGPGSLRQAILDANANPGVDFIDAGFGVVVRPVTPLPTITDSVKMATETVTIDGSGAGAANGLVITSNENDLGYITVQNFSGDGIVFRGSSKNRITGLISRSNGGNGLVFENCTDTQLGAVNIGTTHYDTNIAFIDNGGYGLLITGSARLDLSFGAGLLYDALHPNRLGGVRVVDATALRIGIPGQGSVGVFTGAKTNGIELVNVTKSFIQSTVVGIRYGYQGTIIGSCEHGILVEGGSENTFDGNWLGGCAVDGVLLRNTRQNKLTGQHFYKNHGNGIVLSGSSENIIGGDSGYELNYAENNEGSGIVLAAGSTGNQVGSSRVDLQACKLEYSIVSPK